MTKEDYIEIVNAIIVNQTNARNIMLEQIENFYKASYKVNQHNYKVGDKVFLKKGTLLHGTFKNMGGLEEIAKNGLVSSWFIDARNSKYPSSVGVWNLKKDYYLEDYINFYSGGTVRYYNHLDNENETEVIAYDKMFNFINKVKEKGYLVWKMEQTKEARFLPSLVQNKVQIGIIFNADNEEIKPIIENDILSTNINDQDVEVFVNEYYYKQFLIDRKNKDDFFTDRESAIIFGIPSCFIEGVLVGREYENDIDILNRIKKILPNCYICNLDGKVILV